MVMPNGTPMSAKAMQENGNEKRLLISVRVALRSRRAPDFSCSINCERESAERRRPLLFLLVKLLQADRQSSFREADAIADLAQIVGILRVALLVTRVVEMQETGVC